ncbi:hypothetical protein ACFO4N_08380 [Camelliibacillus cellulosilyticus]|uniref:Uncharacterized protein n=1 Tax=Camelliibacillus cellulosilyticus TaxID=2174486 RepID=A0ABV9GP73_9BACL
MTTFIMNLCAQSNAVVTGKNMAINPREKANDELVNSDLFPQTSITEEQSQELIDMISRRVKNAFTTSGLKAPEVAFAISKN